MTTTAESNVRAPRATRLVRPRDCVVSGVSVGLAAHLGWRPSTVRWLFAGASLLSGAGALLYLWLWAMTPFAAASAPAAEPVTAPAAASAAGFAPAAASSPPGRPEASPVVRRLPVPVLLLGLAALIALASLGRALADGRSASLLALTVPLCTALALGSVAWSRVIEPPVDAEAVRSARLLRIGAGCGLVGVAIVLALAAARPSSGWLYFLTLLTLAAAAAVAAGPQLLALRRDSDLRRTAAVRDEQRAEMAAHLHDSVLQTLALIQNRAGASSEVARIARAQERELRDWLYAGSPVASRDLAAELRDFAAALELDNAVRIDVVVVGAVGESMGRGAATGELAAAAREAMLNAARHAGGDVSVYLEASDDSVDVFVRDRGPGFALDDVPEDRLGVRESIIGRMRRAGGTAKVRAGASGVGTEVQLHLDRAEREAKGQGHE